MTFEQISYIQKKYRGNEGMFPNVSGVLNGDENVTNICYYNKNRTLGYDMSSVGQTAEKTDAVLRDFIREKHPDATFV